MKDALSEIHKCDLAAHMSTTCVAVKSAGALQTPIGTEMFSFTFPSLLLSLSRQFSVKLGMG